MKAHERRPQVYILQVMKGLKRHAKFLSMGEFHERNPEGIWTIHHIRRNPSHP
jgi:hypothetical protein